MFIITERRRRTAPYFFAAGLAAGVEAAAGREGHLGEIWPGC